MGLIVLATVGPIDSLADNFVFGHMIQHTILFDQAALLLALGLTGPVLVPILTKPGVKHLQVLMHPVVAVVLWLVVMYGWHLPVCYQVAAEHEVIHLCEHACFITAGVVMWLALLGPFPKPEWFGNGAKAIYVAIIHFSTMGLANILMWSGTVLYPFYVASDHAHGVEPLTDQSLAGVVLMIQSGIVMLGVFFWLVLRWAREDTERQELLDLAHERGIDLDARRAGRAVSAGRGAELRRRLVAREASENTTSGGDRRLVALGSLALRMPPPASDGLRGNGRRGGSSSGATASPATSPAATPSRPNRPRRSTSPTTAAPVDLAKLKGRPVLVAFLYTHCHDLCPSSPPRSTPPTRRWPRRARPLSWPSPSTPPTTRRQRRRVQPRPPDRRRDRLAAGLARRN